VAVARALVREPRLLLADEPTGALDTETGNLVIEVMRAATDRGCGLILVTHDWDHANKMQRVLRLSDGVLHPAIDTRTGGSVSGPAQGTPAEEADRTDAERTGTSA
jgi:putative ABC transport system ATP-binding protein